MEENNILCASSVYEKKYYLNPAYASLPQAVQDELKIMCVLFTEEVGGILTLYFDEDGDLLIETSTREDDILFDEIGAALKVKQIRRERGELLEQLEMYYKAVVLGDTSVITS